MAKFNHGVFSRAINKLGGVVFQQYEGMQIGKEYQPNVKNPQTPLQMTNRATFKLASQIVALYKSVFIVAAAAVSIYERKVRGALVRVLVRNADTTGEDPKILPADVAAAVNSLQGVTVVPMPTFAGESISQATINATSGDVIEYTIVAKDRESNILGSATRRITSDGTPQSIQAPLTAETPDGYDIMAVSIRSITEDGLASISNITATYDLEITRRVNAGDVAVSPVAYAGFAG